MKTQDKVRYLQGRHRRRRSRRKSWISYAGPVIAVLAVLWVGLYFVRLPQRPAQPSSPVAAAPQAAAAPVERTAALPPLNLPADDAAHGSGMEWWYYSGILDAKDGHRYSFHVAVFVANSFVKHTVMHVALTDLQNGMRYSGQRRTGGLPANGIANGFDFRLDDWTVAATGPSHEMHAAFQGVALSLNMNDAGQPVAHRAADSATPGLLDFGASGISYYYSRPRVAAQGEITIGGQTVPVSGDVWFDHQWGDFDVLTLGWDWFALHLADGSDVMLYELFDAQGRKVMTAGTVSNSKGSTPLRPADIQLTPGATWTSPATKIDYVVEWTIKLPSGVLNIKPFVPDSEFDAHETTANIYWEGPVKVGGSQAGQGFMELSGYDRLKTAQAVRH